ncbi:MAG: hypothetical protein Q8755_03200 [Candidatus Phytoplasma australasiaticum]|nr:hypothetical protein [Candidatus Phytoplasma australasiaticum]
MKNKKDYHENNKIKQYHQMYYTPFNNKIKQYHQNNKIKQYHQNKT